MVHSFSPKILSGCPPDFKVENPSHQDCSAAQDIMEFKFIRKCRYLEKMVKEYNLNELFFGHQWEREVGAHPRNALPNSAGSNAAALIRQTRVDGSSATCSEDVSKSKLKSFYKSSGKENLLTTGAKGIDSSVHPKTVLSDRPRLSKTRNTLSRDIQSGKSESRSVLASVHQDSNVDAPVPRATSYFNRRPLVNCYLQNVTETRVHNFSTQQSSTVPAKANCYDSSKIYDQILAETLASSKQKALAIPTHCLSTPRYTRFMYVQNTDNRRYSCINASVTVLDETNINFGKGKSSGRCARWKGMQSLQIDANRCANSMLSTSSSSSSPSSSSEEESSFSDDSSSYHTASTEDSNSQNSPLDKSAPKLSIPPGELSTSAQALYKYISDTKSLAPKAPPAKREGEDKPNTEDEVQTGKDKKRRRAWMVSQFGVMLPNGVYFLSYDLLCLPS